MLGFFEVYQEVVVGKYTFGEKVKNIQMYWKKKKLAAAADPASPSHLPHFLFKKGGQTTTCEFHYGFQLT